MTICYFIIIQKIKHRSFKTTIFLVLIRQFQIRNILILSSSIWTTVFQNYALSNVHPFVINFSDKKIFFTTTFNVNKCLYGEIIFFQIAFILNLSTNFKKRTFVYKGLLSTFICFNILYKKPISYVLIFLYQGLHNMSLLTSNPSNNCVQLALIYFSPITKKILRNQ